MHLSFLYQTTDFSQHFHFAPDVHTIEIELKRAVLANLIKFRDKAAEARNGAPDGYFPDNVTRTRVGTVLVSFIICLKWCQKGGYLS